MTPVRACSICGGAIVGFGNDAWPVNDDRCCDQCDAERVIPALRLRERDAKRKGSNGGGLQMIDLNDIEDDSFLVIHADCGCSWPMKADRSIVRRLRNDSPTCWKMPNFAELSDRISVQAKLGASLRGFPIGMTCGG